MCRFFYAVLIMGLLVFSSLLQADEPIPKIVTYEIKNMNSPSKKIVGNLGMISIYSDFLPTNDKINFAFVALHDLNGEEPLVVSANVSIYKEKCSGLPKTYLVFAEVEGEKSVFPQTFAVSGDSCIEIELYGFGQSMSDRKNDKLELIDSFKIAIKMAN